jgi:small ligand-binding sensory domain FIST
MPSMLLLVDPSCPAINDLISGLDYACPQAAKLGGIAGQHSASHGSLLFSHGAQEQSGVTTGGVTTGGVTTGAVGCLIGGKWRLDPLVAQGCRPIGPVLEVEQAQRNVVLEVSEGSKRNSPVAALQSILTSLIARDAEDRARPVAPLVAAADATIIHTDEVALADVVEQVVAEARKVAR